MGDRSSLAILGGSFSGNKGAASMTRAVATGMAERLPGIGVRVFSPYPSADRQQESGIEIMDFTPRVMVSLLPAALLALVTGRRWKPKRGVGGALAGSAAVADVSGISFVDGRGVVTLVYNVLLVAIPAAFGVPVVKMAQAMGPFDEVLNRLAARLVLPRARWIGLRGQGTAENVSRLRLHNAEPAADVAFLLEPTPEEIERAARLLPTERTTTVIAPSAVVEESSAAAGIDYHERMVEVVDGLAAAGHEVMLIAHSARTGAGAGRTNDLPLCRRIAEASSASLIDEELDAGVLRALIGRSRILVASRFHAMISGLATGTPTFVVGWSHKYREVLSEFGLDEWAVDFRELTPDHLVEAIVRLDASSDDVRDATSARLPGVKADARKNLDRLTAVLGER